MASRMIAALVIGAGLATPASSRTQEPSSPGPPPGVFRAEQVDVRPRPVKQPRPNYTADAMRARITGAVVLECVVQPDGTVGEVRVTRSLDPQNGLDDQAVRTLKQWQFIPGMKDGKPVAVLVQVQLTFTIRDGPRPSPSLSWPSGFTGSSAGTEDDRKWSTTEFDSGGIRFHIEYPDGWKIQRDPSVAEVVRITNAAETAALSLEKPRLSVGAFDTPLEAERVQAVVDRMKHDAQLKSPNLDVLAFGQIWGQPGRIWIWMEWSLAGRHAWRFHTGTGGTEIRITLVENLRAASARQFARLDAVTADFGAMLRRMTMAVSP